MKWDGVILTVLLALSAVVQLPAQTVTLNMNEAPNQLLNGLVINKGGLGFTFSNPSAFLHFNVTSGLGAVTYVADPVIQGNNSPLGVAFSVPIANFQFGMVVESNVLVGSIATVALFNNSGTPFATLSANSTLADPFAEGQFTYNGGLGPVTNILITPTGNGFTAFSFDNLTVTAAPPTPPGTAGVPVASPLSLGIIAICLAGITMLMLRQQAA